MVRSSQVRFAFMRLRGKRHATALAIVFAALALVLFVVVLAQAEMLYTKGWRLALGTVPEWMAGFGTVFTAIAAVAAFGTLSVATREWATGEAERRDHVMSQARLIIVEPAPAVPVLPRSEADDVVIRNHSSAPVFNLHIDDSYVLESKGKQALTEEFRPGRPNDPIVYSTPRDVPVLAPADATPRLRVGGQPFSERTEYVGFHSLMRRVPGGGGSEVNNPSRNFELDLRAMLCF